MRKKMVRPNTRFISVWLKTHKELKRLSKKRQEPMTLVVQRAVEKLTDV